MFQNNLPPELFMLIHCMYMPGHVLFASSFLHLFRNFDSWKILFKYVTVHRRDSMSPVSDATISNDTATSWIVNSLSNIPCH